MSRPLRPSRWGRHLPDEEGSGDDEYPGESEGRLLAAEREEAARVEFITTTTTRRTSTLRPNA